MLRRKVYNQLLEWKSVSHGTTAMLIEGARRIGKSYIAEEFARREYESYILVDFSKVPKPVKEWFELYLEDLDTLLMNLQLHYKTRLKVRHSVLIFDEVQACPPARAAIKHLVKDGRFDYIETGSLVSIKKNVKDILIPSEEDSIDMQPMDFEEFLWAMGEDMLMPYIRQCFEQKKPMEAFHRRAMDLFRQYMIVGGMPQAVLAYLETRDFSKVDYVKRQILKLYRNDIKKYAENAEARVTAIYDELPGQLQKHEKKFRLSALKENARMRNYENAFFWLSDAKIVNCCYNTTEPNVGLRLNEERTTLKCYMCDTGLLISHAFGTKDIVADSLYQKLMFGKLEVNEGMLVENVVAQMLVASGHKLFFFSRHDEKNAENRMEVDFLIQKSVVTSRHNISPIEVKSSNRYTLMSLRKCIGKYANYLYTPYVIHSADLKSEDGIMYIPLYMTPCL
ncbi:MAG: ATP-binding protein [Bacteroidaceae bacterium]|nr:ATP-binding protein [Bacteroidaceae bacterium]